MVSDILIRVVDAGETLVPSSTHAREVEVPSSEVAVVVDIPSSSPTTRDVVELNGEHAPGVEECSPPGTHSSG